MQFDASSSFSAPGGSITSYIWNVNGAAVDTTNVPLHSLQFDEGGVSLVSVVVVDSAGCASIPSAPIQVLVSALPDFNGTYAPAVVCAGNSFVLNGMASPQAYAPLQLNCSLSGNGLPIPDNVGVEFTSTIMVNGAVPGSVINSTSDLGDICVDLEHSYMGDLVIAITCPNGQSTTLHQQGGGSTFLGDANDSDTNVPLPGTCWYYCWNDNATLGTWEESATFGTTPNVVIAPFSGYPALAPDTYSPVQPLSNLIGCPVDGPWTISIVDLWGADNGYLCNWCNGFNSEVDSTYIILGPQLGSGPDSAYWSGPNIENDTDIPGLATAVSNATGIASFTYHVMDTYGCIHDTTVIVSIADPLVEAGQPVDLCDGPGILEGSAIGAGGTCGFTLLLHDSFGDGWNGGAFVEVITDGDTLSYSHDVPGAIEISVALPVVGGQELQLIYVPGALFNTENSFTLLSDAGDTLYISGNDPFSGIHFNEMVDCLPFQALWSPANGLSDPTVLQPSVYATVSEWYTLTVTVPGPAGCSASDSVWVDASGAMIIGITLDAATPTICTDNVAEEFIWYHNGQIYSSTAEACLDSIPYGNWQVVAIPQEGCAMASADTLYCPVIELTESSGTLIVEGETEGVFTWYYEGSILPDLTGPTIEIEAGGTYGVTLVTPYGCTLSASILVAGGMSLSEATTPIQFSLHPNPSQGYVIINGIPPDVDMLNINVRDVAGRIVFTGSPDAVEGRAEFRLNAVTSGTYFVQIGDNNGMAVLRLVLEQ